MRKTFNILYISTLIIAVSFWGDVVAAINDSALYLAATEMVEKVDENEKEVKSCVDTFEKIEVGGQGGRDFEEEMAYQSESPISFLTLEKPVIPSHVVYETTVLFKKYNSKLINSLTHYQLYILYRCPKSYLV